MNGKRLPDHHEGKKNIEWRTVKTETNKIK